MALNAFGWSTTYLLLLLFVGLFMLYYCSRYTHYRCLNHHRYYHLSLARPWTTFSWMTMNTPSSHFSSTPSRTSCRVVLLEHRDRTRCGRSIGKFCLSRKRHGLIGVGSTPNMCAPSWQGHDLWSPCRPALHRDLESTQGGDALALVSPLTGGVSLVSAVATRRWQLL